VGPDRGFTDEPYGSWSSRRSADRLSLDAATPQRTRSTCSFSSSSDSRARVVYVNWSRSSGVIDHYLGPSWRDATTRAGGSVREPARQRPAATLAKPERRPRRDSLAAVTRIAPTSLPITRRARARSALRLDHVRRRSEVQCWGRRAERARLRGGRRETPKARGLRSLDDVVDAVVELVARSRASSPWSLKHDGRVRSGTHYSTFTGSRERAERVEERVSELRPEDPTQRRGVRRLKAASSRVRRRVGVRSQSRCARRR
jgi:hypothetical protein